MTDARYRALYPVNGFVKVGDELRLSTDSGEYRVPDDVRAAFNANPADERLIRWEVEANRYANERFAGGEDDIRLPGLASQVHMGGEPG